MDPIVQRTKGRKWTKNQQSPAMDSNICCRMHHTLSLWL